MSCKTVGYKGKDLYFDPIQECGSKEDSTTGLGN